MTKSHSQTPAQETDRRSDAVHGRHMGETEPKAEGSDTEHEVEPKGNGLGVKATTGAARSSDGDPSRREPETETGPMTGFDAETARSGKRSPDPTGDTEKPPKTGLDAEPIDEPHGGKLGLSASPAAKSPADR